MAASDAVSDARIGSAREEADTADNFGWSEASTESVSSIGEDGLERLIEPGQQGVGSRHIGVAGRIFNRKRTNHAIVDDHGVTL